MYQIKQLLTIPWLHKRKLKPGRVGLAIAPEGLAVAFVNAETRLQHCQFYPRTDDTATQLRELVSQLELEDTPCSVILHPAYYQLLLAEAPAVEAAEMAAAVRWKVKELLDYPLDDAAIESFSLPDDAYRGRQKMLYAAAMRKPLLQDLVDPVEQSGLAVDCIEIAELAMHNLIARLPSEPGGVALIQLYESGGFINLVEDGAIYLSRRLDAGLGRYQPAGDNSAFFESLFLEVQRSLDYYESQLGKGIITQLLYSPGLPETAAIGQFLSGQLGLNVAALDLAPLQLVAVVDEELDEQMARCAAAIGAALGPYSGQEAARAAS